MNPAFPTCFNFIVIISDHNCAYKSIVMPFCSKTYITTPWCVLHCHLPLSPVVCKRKITPFFRSTAMSAHDVVRPAVSSAFLPFGVVASAAHNSQCSLFSTCALTCRQRAMAFRGSSARATDRSNDECNKNVCLEGELMSWALTIKCILLV